METIEKTKIERLNELSEETIENFENVSPVELPENDAKEEIKGEVSFTGETVNVCVCGVYSGITCPMG